MQTPKLNPAESLMLDMIRISASMLVAFGHLTQVYFSTGWPDLTSSAQAAVVVFFLLSGFVIRHVTTRRPATFTTYGVDRLSRIHSVAIPALLFTLILDSISRHHNPSYYNAFWDQYHSHPLGRIALNLVFLGEQFGHFTAPLSNSPYWSVSWEVVYYLIYGVFFYVTRRWRWPLLVALLLFATPRILALLPIWVGGCILHDFYMHGNSIWRTASIRRIAAAMLALASVVLLVPILSVKHLVAIPLWLLLAVNANVGGRNYLLSIVWALLLFGLLRLSRCWNWNPKGRLYRGIRFAAEGTFPIYLFHFPLFVFIGACIPYNHASASAKLIIFAVTIALGIALGVPCNHLKLKIRDSLLRRKAKVPDLSAHPL